MSPRGSVCPEDPLGQWALGELAASLPPPLPPAVTTAEGQLGVASLNEANLRLAVLMFWKRNGMNF